MENARIIRELGRINLSQVQEEPVLTLPEIGLGIGGLALVTLGTILEGKLASALLGVGTSMTATTIFFVLMSRSRRAP